MIRVRSNRYYDCDVVVAGGGPAGASAAARLADKGYDVVLADRSQFPRDKVCGDFVGPSALVELGSLGISGRAQYRQSNVVRSAALFLDGELLIEQLLPEVGRLPTHGRVIPRMVLDNWLWKAALDRGVRPLEKHKVTAYADDAEGVTVTLSGPTPRLRCRLLLAADGSASTIARQLAGDKPDRRDRIVAVRAYYEGVDGPIDRCDLMFSRDSFPGYYWLFPTGPGSANVGLGMLLETLPATTARLSDLLDELIQRDPAFRQRLRNARQIGTTIGWPLITYNMARRATANRLMLLGDAAGLINPINGEGIQYALESGRWAAAAAARALAQNALDARGLAPYEAMLRERMDYDMALVNLIVTLIRNRTLNPLWLTALRVICARARHDPEYARLAGGILAGLAPARDVISLRMILGTMEQAAVSAGFGAVRSAMSGGASQAAATLVRELSAMLRASTSDTAGLTLWGLDVLRSGVRLAGKVGSNMFADAAEPV
jgi:menaquinone-9 beta-reductase